MKCCFTVLLALASVSAGLLSPPVMFGQEPEHENLNTSGTLKAAGAGVIQIAAGEKGEEMWLLKVEAKPEDITFSGTAEKTFLRPGMNVEFRAAINKRGMVPEPVAMLAVFTPSEGRPLGVQSDSDVGGGGPGLFDEANEKKKEKKPAKTKGDAKPKGDDTVYRVAGTISKIGRAGDLTVSADGVQVKANLAEDCKISIDLNDLSFATAGDKVAVQGWFYKGRPGEGAATKIDVTAANPLTDGTKKKPTKPVKEAKTAAKGAKAAKGEKPMEQKTEEGKKDGDKAEKPDTKKDE